MRKSLLFVSLVLLGSAGTVWAGDGLGDLVVVRPGTGDPAGGVWMYYNSGGQTFDFTAYWGSIESDPLDTPLAGDFTGDGYADLLRYRDGNGISGDVNEFDQIWVYRNTTGEGTEGLEYDGRWLNGSAWDDGDYLVAGDWNGDGITDIMVFRPTAGIWQFGNWLYIGTGTGFDYLGYWGKFGLEPNDRIIAGDFDGDGYCDVMALRNGNGIVGHPNEFDQGFVWINGLSDDPNTSYPGWMGDWPAGRWFNGDMWDDTEFDFVQAADVTGDGYADLIVTRDGNGIVGDPKEFDKAEVYKNVLPDEGVAGVWYDGPYLNGQAWDDGDHRFFADFGPQPAPPQCGDANHPHPMGDLNQDCYVNWEDFTLFAEHWLECTDPDPPCNYNP